MTQAMPLRNTSLTAAAGHWSRCKVAVVPSPLDMLDANTGRMRVRRVDVDSTAYAIARRYMIRLCKDDFASDETIKQYADLAGMMWRHSETDLNRWLVPSDRH